MSNPKAAIRAALALVIAVGIGLAITYRHELNPARIKDWLDDYGAFVPLTFVIAHIAASLFFIPRTLMAVLAGIMFGKWWGPVWSVAGSMFGAYVGYAAARYINAGKIRPEDMRRIGPLLKRAEESGWRMIAIIRVLPLPHTPQNFAFGLTRVRVRDYMIGSLIGFVPASIICAELGASGRYAITSVGEWIQLSVWCAAFVLVTIFLSKFTARWSHR